MDYRQAPSRPRPQLPLPGRGALKPTSFWELARFIVTTMLLVLTIEYFFGHPAIRWSGRGGDDMRYMVWGEFYTIIGERHIEGGYRTMFAFIKEPDWTLRGWIVEKAQFLYASVNSSIL